MTNDALTITRVAIARGRRNRSGTLSFFQIIMIAKLNVTIMNTMVRSIVDIVSPPLDELLIVISHHTINDDGSCNGDDHEPSRRWVRGKIWGNRCLTRDHFACGIGEDASA